MQRTITRLYDDRQDALEAARALETLGVPTSDISLIASNRDQWYDASNGASNGHGRKDRDHDGRDDRAEGATKGAATGGVLGAGAGLLAGLGLMAIPGLGPVVAAGWLASTAAGAAAGAVGGGAVGGLLGALRDSGVPEEEAHVFSEGVRRGGTLLTVRTDDTRQAEIEATLGRYRAADVGARGQAYRAEGWSRFDTPGHS